MLRYKHHAFAFGALALTGLLAACSGGGSRSTITPQVTQLPAPLATVNITIQIPGRGASSSDRSTKYVGVATQSATFAVIDSSGKPLTPVTVNCTTVCQASLSVTPGNDTFTISLFDKPNGGGSVLSSGTVKSTIVLGTANVVNIVFNGVVAKIVIDIQPPTVPVGTATTVPVIVQAEDKDGNIILGGTPYNVPITLANSDTSGTTTLSATSVTQPLTPVTLTYNGGTSLNQVAISASASGISKAAQVVFGISGGGSAISSANPGDPSRTDAPLRPPTPSPTPVPTPSPRPSAAIVAAAQPPIAALQASGSNLQGFINTASKTATLIVNSQTNVAPFRDAIPAANFQIQTNTTLTPLSLRAPSVVDLSAIRMAHRVQAPAHFDRPLMANPMDNLRPLTGAAANLRRTKAIPLVIPQIGATQNFNITGVAASGDNVPLTFTLVGITNSKVYVWFDNQILADANGSLGSVLAAIDSSYNTITSTFGGTSYPTTAPGIVTYGTCDPGGASNGGTAAGTIPDSGVTYALITRPLATALGYFWSMDYNATAVNNCIPNAKNNEAPVSITAWTGQSTAEKMYNLRSTYTHELMHQVQFVQKRLINAGVNEVSWLAEGLGTYSQDTTAPGGIDNDGGVVRAATFLAAPQNYTFTGFAGVENGAIVRGNATVYGMAYLFISYLADRFGPQVPKQLLVAPTAGADSITAVTGQPFNQLLSDFSVALMLSNTGVTTDPRYTFKKLNLRGAYPSSYSGNTLTLTGPATISTLSAGQPSEFINMYQNGFAYFSFNGLGTTAFGVKVNDQGNGALQLSGSISQQ